MASSCSHWWHAPIYITVSIVLAIVAITTTTHSNTKPQTPFPSNQDSLITHQLSTNTSRSLRNSGFHFMSTLLQISPELFLPASSSTIFAIQDTAISNISLPPLLMRDLLWYHTSSITLSLDDLLKQPQGSCVPTLPNGKNLSITKIVNQERLVEINGVLISHPDIFSHGLYSIHGVVAPFFSINHTLEQKQDWGFIKSHVCGQNMSVNANETQARNMWNRVIRQLSSNGYVSCAIGLRSVLDRILIDYTDLSSVTIFAPLDFAYIASPSPMLERLVRLHILPERYEYRELVSVPAKASLRTLFNGDDLEVTEDYNAKGVLGINGLLHRISCCPRSL
ncbi:hypothetical protein IFM89_038368 [Coptis chinensis]|uniref:FAS1 domain-containing protein n=1 Tax=Coptis chinensis TaxID=261450 RepID=A0A835H048_9MAGN|nr:hypothetical protein IFM89_038368 [Coptis chinensis]